MIVSNYLWLPRNISFILGFLLFIGNTISSDKTCLGFYQEFTIEGSYGMLDPTVKKIAFLRSQTVNGIVKKSLIIKNLENGEEIEVDKRAQGPPLGWIDSVNLLIYKSYKASTLAGDVKLNQVLYKYNIENRNVSPITSIPLDSTFNNIFATDGELVYGTCNIEDSTTKIFKHNLIKSERFEFLIPIKNNIELDNLSYNPKKQILSFIENLDSVRTLKILTQTHQISVEKLKFTEKPKLTFDNDGERLYYTDCKTLPNGQDQYFIKSYNIQKKKSSIIYKLPPNQRCTFLDNVNKNKLLISLSIFPNGFDNLIKIDEDEEPLEQQQNTQIKNQPKNILKIININELKPIDY